MFVSPSAFLVASQRFLAQSYVPIIDGHNDFPIWIRAYYHNHIYGSNFSANQELFGQVDFPRLRQGHVGAQFWSVYVDPSSGLGTVDEAYYESIHDTLQQIDLVHRLIEEFPEHLQFATSSQEVLGKLRVGGPLHSFLGIEGLHQIGNSASILRMYHRLGVRYATLTHTCHNAYADSEGPHTPLHQGLSPAGIELIAEMNRIGIMVDLSHTSFDTQRDALAHSKAPVIYSHSNAFSVCAHTRNVPDNILLQLRQNGGIVMVTFYPEYTNCQNKNDASLSDIADHIEYIGNFIGYRHVGIGSDFDGMPQGPSGMEDVSKYPDLLEELTRRGVSTAELDMVAHRNILRVLGEVERVATGMRKQRPLEDDVKSFFDISGKITW
ncbi:renal dipeptidase family [Lophiotrema nucula]|uniref:Dipeptidase n=1 Tax=Lophiotrema nucula TaxID=690887 RepID=A0A6A5YJI3_9PLEO|nr:renal dipeptidase family [Lophiotrema nucula]